MKKNLIIKIVIAVFVIYCVVDVIIDPPKIQQIKEEAPVKSEYDKKNGAYTAAIRIVKAGLKTPSTAQFADYTKSKVTKLGNVYIVDSYVDSQNLFGAMIRSDFVIKLKKVGNHWDIVEFVFDGEKFR